CTNRKVRTGSRYAIDGRAARMSKEGSVMAECGRLGSGGVWTRMLVVFVTGSFLAGCVSVETMKKREKESEGYYKEGLSVLDTDQQRAFVSFQKAIQTNPANRDAH